MVRPRPAPDPARHSPCARCGLAHPPAARWPEGTVCQYCYLAARRTTGSCRGCAHEGVLPGRDRDGQPICRSCSGIPLTVDCRRCGAEGELHSGGRCWACVLEDQVRTVLAGPRGPVPPALEPLALALAAMPRPNSGVTWLRSPAVAQLLRALASSTTALTHHDLDVLPGSRTIEYIRGLLVGQGVLPSRDRRLADFQRWLEQRLVSIDRDDHRRVLERYGRWHHLRRLRTQSVTAPVSEAAFERAEQCVTVAGQFLRWLAAADLTLDQALTTCSRSWPFLSQPRRGRPRAKVGRGRPGHRPILG